MPQLIVSVKSNYPQIHDLSVEKISIGRTRDNDIVLYDSCVSVTHAELIRKKDGSYRINDLDSSNGTAVNGSPVDGTILKDGDQINFGTVKALFLETDRPSDTPSGEKDPKSNEKEIAARQSLDSLEKDVQSKSEELSRLEKTLEKKSKHLDTVKVGKIGKLEQASAELKRQNDIEEKNLKSFQSQVQTAQEKQKELQARVAELETSITEKQQSRAKLEEDCSRIRDTTESSLKQKEELDAELNRLQKEISEHSSVLEEQKQAAQQANTVIEEAKAAQEQLTKLEADLKSRHQISEEIDQQIAASKKTQEALTNEAAERNRELAELKTLIEKRQQEAADLASEVDKNQGLVKSVTGKLSTMEATLQKSLDDLSRTMKTQKSLKEEALTLSRQISAKTVLLESIKDKVKARESGIEAGTTCPPFRVINPGMRSLVHYFHQGAGIPDQERVDPIGYYALAACTKGSMHREVDTLPQGDEPILLLLHGVMEKDRELIESISREMPERVLLICWREGQLDALAREQKTVPESLHLSKLIKGVSGIVSVDPRTGKLLEELSLGKPHLNIPSPCPVEFPEWNIPNLTSKRPRGVFVSGGGYDPDSQLHRARLELLNKLVVDAKITLTLDHNVPKLVTGLKIPDDLITVGATPLKYSEYLNIMRKHYLVAGFGKNLAGGEVVGDAILSRTVFIGADAANSTEELLFPDSCIKDHNIESALKNATHILSDHAAYAETVEQAQRLAPQLISFESVSDRLNEFVRFISANPAGV